MNDVKNNEHRPGQLIEIENTRGTEHNNHDPIQPHFNKITQNCVKEFLGENRHDREECPNHSRDPQLDIRRDGVIPKQKKQVAAQHCCGQQRDP